MSETSQYRRIATELRGGCPRIGTRLALTFILACALATTALLGAWGYSMLFPDTVVFPASATINLPAGITTGTASNTPITISMTTATRWYRVRDETVAAAFVIVGFVWLLLVWWLWRSVERGRAAIGTILFTLAMANVVFVALVLCELSTVRRLYRDELIVGVPLVIATLATVVAWVRLYRGSSW